MNTIKMLTIKELKAMKPGTVFAEGEGLYPILHNEPIRWVAKRGDIHDWAIYYHHARMSYQYVETNGDKVMSEKAIKTLVPCEQEAYKMYRY